MTNTIDKQSYFKDIEVLDKRLMRLEDDIERYREAVNNMFKLIELLAAGRLK